MADDGTEEDRARLGGEEKKPSKVDEWRQYFQDRGLGPADVPLAVVVHEVRSIPCFLLNNSCEVKGVSKLTRRVDRSWDSRGLSVHGQPVLLSSLPR